SRSGDKGAEGSVKFGRSRMSLFPSSTERRVEYEEGNILSDWRRGRCAAGVAGSTAGKRLYWKLSFGLWWDGHPELCTAYAERGNGLSDPGRCSSGTLRRGVSFPAQTVSNDFILECPGVQLYAGAFLIVL